MRTRPSVCWLAACCWTTNGGRAVTKLARGAALRPARWALDSVLRFWDLRPRIADASGHGWPDQGGCHRNQRGHVKSRRVVLETRIAGPDGVEIRCEFGPSETDGCCCTRGGRRLAKDGCSAPALLSVCPMTWFGIAATRLNGSPSDESVLGRYAPGIPVEVLAGRLSWVPPERLRSSRAKMFGAKWLAWAADRLGFKVGVRAGSGQGPRTCSTLTPGLPRVPDHCEGGRD